MKESADEGGTGFEAYWVNIHLPRTLRGRLKAEAARAGRTLQDELMEAVEYWLVHCAHLKMEEPGT